MTDKTLEQIAQDQENEQRGRSLMGHHAAALLANPAYGVTWDFLRRGILEGWATLPADDQETALMLQLQIKLLDKLKQRFEALVAAGHEADADMRRKLEELQAREEMDGQNVFVRSARAVRQRMRA